MYSFIIEYDSKYSKPFFFLSAPTTEPFLIFPVSQSFINLLVQHLLIKQKANKAIQINPVFLYTIDGCISNRNCYYPFYEAE